tara:strand:+ start:21041 stop:21484 length:444 start_codon:yes stop_codon:yes gene_type:complete
MNVLVANYRQAQAENYVGLIPRNLKELGLDASVTIMPDQKIVGDYVEEASGTEGSVDVVLMNASRSAVNSDGVSQNPAEIRATISQLVEYGIPVIAETCHSCPVSPEEVRALGAESLSEIRYRIDTDPLYALLLKHHIPKTPDEPKV